MSFQTADKLAKREILQTGIKPLDSLLGGGLEMGLTYFLYGSRTIRECLHRIAVHAQFPPEKGGMNTPSILIDSENMLRIEYSIYKQRYTRLHDYERWRPWTDGHN
ncbi:MAG: hypothetical protein ACTSWA_02705 [Candidatus Thorarchaeota archaeon]